jgi:hypothetical protein
MAVTPPPSANQVPVRFTYTASGITFAKANENNIAIANTQSGIGELTDVIDPVTLASGTITVSTTTVNGVGTAFRTDFAAGQYLFYYNNEGEPALLGKIFSVTNDVLMTLAATTATSVADVYCGMASTILGTSESLMIRIPVVASGPNVIIPNWAAYRVIETPLDASAFNNSTFSNLEQYSNVNAPQTPAPTLVNIPYTIQPVYNFQSYQTIVSGQKTTLYFQTAANFPSFCYAVLNPYGEANSVLAANTLYKLFASESFSLNGIVATIAYSQQLLTLAGY